VLRLVIGKGMFLALTGVAIGLVGSFGLTRLMTTLLFEVKPTDTVTFATVAVALIVIALIACYIGTARNKDRSVGGVEIRIENLGFRIADFEFCSAQRKNV
jgi:ABC-type antimicrobial peptide transport system permease subunit